ncbi:MAG: murein hydrolase activator EnvC family protein [Dethiobacteria bacterium]
MARKRYFFWMILTITALMATVFTAYASPLEERQQEHEELQNKIESQQGELEAMQKHEKELLSELRRLEGQIKQIEQELNELNNRIANTEQEIAVTEEELAEAEEQLAYKKDLLKRRLRAIYEHGNVSYLEVLFEASSFGDFLTKLNNLKIIADNDFQLLCKVEEEKKIVEAKKLQLEEQRSELLTMRRDSLLKKEKLEETRIKQEQVLAALQEEINKQEEAIAALEQEAKKLEGIIAALMAEMRQPPSRSGKGLIWPTADFQRGWITSGYGYRTNPITGARGSWHGAIDIGIPYPRWPASASYNGNPVYIRAVDNGIVAFSGWQVGPGQLRGLPIEEDDRVPSSTQWWKNGGFGYGRLVVIHHGEGLATVYGHVYKRLVNTGDYVTQGQPIAIVGSTGWSTGPHLHFEVRKSSDPNSNDIFSFPTVDPLSYLP